MLKSKPKQLEPKQAESAAPQRREGERSEPDRSGGAADSGGAAPISIPDPEVPAKPRRRQFTAEYKSSRRSVVRIYSPRPIFSITSSDSEPKRIPAVDELSIVTII